MDKLGGLNQGEIALTTNIVRSARERIARRKEERAMEITRIECELANLEKESTPDSGAVDAEMEEAIERACRDPQTLQDKIIKYLKEHEDEIVKEIETNFRGKNQGLAYVFTIAQYVMNEFGFEFVNGISFKIPNIVNGKRPHSPIDDFTDNILKKCIKNRGKNEDLNERESVIFDLWDDYLNTIAGKTLLFKNIIGGYLELGYESQGKWKNAITTTSGAHIYSAIRHNDLGTEQTIDTNSHEQVEGALRNIEKTLCNSKTLAAFVNGSGYRLGRKAQLNAQAAEAKDPPTPPNLVLDNFKKLPRLQRAIEVYMKIEAIRGKFHESLGRALFGDQRPIYQFKAEYDNAPPSWMSFMLSATKSKLQRGLEKQASEHPKVESFYEMLKNTEDNWLRGKILYDAGVNEEQRNEGEETMEVAQIVAEHLAEIAVKLEGDLTVGDVDIEELTTHMHVVAALRHGQLSPRQIATKVAEELALVESVALETHDPDAALNAKFAELTRAPTSPSSSLKS